VDPPAERWDPGWYAVGEILELDKKAPLPLLYHLGFIVVLADGGLLSIMMVLSLIVTVLHRKFVIFYYQNLVMVFLNMNRKSYVSLE
jgi:hypothetical protein